MPLKQPLGHTVFVEHVLALRQQQNRIVKVELIQTYRACLSDSLFWLDTGQCVNIMLADRRPLHVLVQTH
jgi:hypothetical protein